MQVRNQFGAMSAFVGNGGLDARLKAEVVAVGTAAGKMQGVVLLPSFLMDGQANHAKQPKSRRCLFVCLFVCLFRASSGRAQSRHAVLGLRSRRQWKAISVQSPTIDLATLWLSKVTQACALPPCAINTSSESAGARARCMRRDSRISVGHP